MVYTNETFIEDYPEFASLPERAIHAQLRQSKIMLHPSMWGNWYNMAQGLWCAHYLALEHDIAEKCAELGLKNPCSVGTVNNQAASTSSVSQSMTVSSMLTADDPFRADFARTVYGMKYLSLLHTVVPAGCITRPLGGMRR